MPLNRFFGRKKDNRAEPADAPEVERANAEPEDDAAYAEEGPPEDVAERRWRDRAAAVLPTGASTGSKRPLALYGDETADAATHFVSASGCRVTDVDGNRFLDCTMALGSVALGYSEPSVVQAVIAAASEGNVSALSSWREVALAERLCPFIACDEPLHFLYNRAEPTAPA